jgi:hypothetical protein
VLRARLEQHLHKPVLAEMQFAYPTFTEAVSMAAQKLCRDIGTGHFPPAQSYLGPPE